MSKEYLLNPATSILVEGKGCIGCKNFSRDIMVSIRELRNNELIDIFLTTEEAKTLIDKIAARLNDNSNN